MSGTEPRDGDWESYQIKLLPEYHQPIRIKVDAKVCIFLQILLSVSVHLMVYEFVLSIGFLFLGYL
jgi:hypothetical protein